MIFKVSSIRGESRVLLSSLLRKSLYACIIFYLDTKQCV
jgi:hypothetical protein